MNDTPESANNELPTSVKPFEELPTGNEEQIDMGPPQVASPEKRTALMLGVLAVVVGGVLYYLFSGSTPAPAPSIPTVKPKATAPTISQAPPVPLVELPPPPQPPKIVPKAPPPPKPPVAIPQPIAPVATPLQQPNAQQLSQRYKTRMLVVAGDSDIDAKKETKKSASSSATNDPNDRFSQIVLSDSSAQVTEAGLMPNIYSTIGQGKIIEAVLETAVDTSLPGQMRAVVSRDTYAEAGKKILIPKGSRLIGVYNTAIRRGQKRLYVIWTRVMRPDGVDIMVGSPGVDDLGRAGMEGFVDNRFFEIFGGSLLISSVGIGFAYGAEELLDLKGISETRNQDGSTTRSGSVTDSAAFDALQQLSDLSSGLLAEMLDTRPIMHIDQGTRVKVFVNRDLVFPGETNFNGVSLVY